MLTVRILEFQEGSSTPPNDSSAQRDLRHEAQPSYSWVSCLCLSPSSQSGNRGMGGASQKFLVISLARADFRKLKIEPLACALKDEMDYRLAAASASCVRGIAHTHRHRKHRAHWIRVLTNRCLVPMRGVRKLLNRHKCSCASGNFVMLLLRPSSAFAFVFSAAGGRRV